MKYVTRSITALALDAAQSFPSVVVTGARRTGKTTLLRKLFPDAGYILLEDPDVQARAQADPRGLMDELTPPVIFDEIQNAPHLLPYVRSRIDYNPRRMGQWLFTGSQEAPLMKGVTESMAGRAAILQLPPLSLRETPKAILLHGGFPEVLAKPQIRSMWFASYIQTYLERDVRAVAMVRDLGTFRRFLGLVATRHGQLINKTDLSASLGLSVPTIGEWLDILEITGQIILVPPYFENYGKRLVKSPKLFIGDSGLACYLLGIQTQRDLDRSPFLGALFEGYIASEIAKFQAGLGHRRELYHFRDQQGLEVDFLFVDPRGGLWMVECKASRTPLPAMAKPMIALRAKMPNISTVRMSVVHRKSRTAADHKHLAPGVEALSVEAFVEELGELAWPPKRRAARR